MKSLNQLLRIFNVLLILISLPNLLYAQFDSPNIDGSISPSEYGDHFNGLNMLATSTSCGGNSTWFVTWDDNNLYVAVTNCFDAVGTGNDALNIYIDIDNHAPVNGGPGSDTGTSFNGNLAILPFRADFFAFAKNGYNAWRNCGSSWSGLDNELVVAIAGSGSSKTIEVQIAWDKITQNNGRPSEFNFLGFLSYNCGVYADIPTLNSNASQCSFSGSSELVRYFTVSSTDSTNSTKPFSQESYTHIGSDISNFGAIDIFDFTMNSPGKSISRFAGNWSIAGILRVHSGTIDFNNAGDACDVNGHCIIANNGVLSLSNAIGGDLIVGSDLIIEGSFIPNDRSVEFDGNGGIQSQTIHSAATVNLDYLIISNPLDLKLGSDVILENDLHLNNGSIILNNYDLELRSGCTISGIPDTNKMIVTNSTGKLIAEVSQAGTYNYPLGEYDGVADYSPVEVNITYLTSSGSTKLVMSVKNTKHPQNPAIIDYLNRYWKIQLSGADSINANITTIYTDSDISGDESSILGLKYSDSTWQTFSNVNEAFNLLEYKNVGTFSDFTGGSPVALPISLKEFETEVIDHKKVLIQWSTESEMNNASFELERGKNGQEFSVIHQLPGAGNSNSLLHYEVIDERPFYGTNYYRLKQTDYDGRSSISEIIYAEIEPEPNEWTIRSYKIAAETYAEIIAPYASNISIQAYDLQGREIYKITEYVEFGKNIIGIPGEEMMIIKLSHAHGTISILLP
ncbi:MAG: hypothetical protein HKN92_07270 [Chitinophagales bacterium]|nr:hypothetical protein [Chitinophagales bacterium]